LDLNCGGRELRIETVLGKDRKTQPGLCIGSLAETRYRLVLTCVNNTVHSCQRTENNLRHDAQP
jgi:hypothetical protein